MPESTDIPTKLGDGARSYRWQVKGWAPFFINAAEEIDRDTFKIKGRHKNESLVVFVHRNKIPFGNLILDASSSIAYLRKTSDGNYCLSLIFGSFTVHQTLKAFLSLRMARRDEREKIAARKRKAIGRKK